MTTETGAPARGAAPDPGLSLTRLLYPEVLADPYPLYDRLRSEDPVHWDHLLHTWVVSRYPDVVTVLQHFTATRSPTPEQLTELGLSGLVPLAEVLVRQMLFLDGRAHARIRNLASAAFTPRRVEALRLHIQEITDGLIDAVQEAGRLDVIADLADPLPAIVTAEMLGLPTSDWRQLTAWATDFAEALGNFQHNPDRSARVLHTLEEMCGYFREAVRRHRQHSRDDLICALLNAEQDGDSLTEDEVVANSIMLLTGGQETTTNLIGNGLLALLRHPDQWALLRADPSLVPSAIEELLRFESPIQYTSRLAPEDLVLGGRRIPRRQAVIALMGAANRDPERFPEPDRLDVRRQDNRHLAFAWGPHFCFGAPLARLEGQVAFETLLRRLPDLALEADRPAWRENLGFRGLTTLPVAFSAGRPAESPAATVEAVPAPEAAAAPAGPDHAAPGLSDARRALLERYLRGSGAAPPVPAAPAAPAAPTAGERREGLVTVQAGGSRTPLFFLHGQWQDVGFYCYQLARALGPDQPFHALEPYRFEGLPAPPPFEELAAAHLRAVRAVQPAGPYRLGGWCNGGLLAYEMARQLHAAGEEVDRLVLMDPVTLVYPAPMRLLHAAVGGAARVLRLGRDAQLDWELRLRHAPRLPLHLARLARHASYRRSRADWRLGRDDYPGIYDWNALSYRPPTRYPGPITFLWSAAEPFRGGWREVEAANEVDVQVLPCRHMTCLNEHLDDLAARLRACLA